jgi:DNA-binding HxlR family transcriptional regulator
LSVTHTAVRFVAPLDPCGAPDHEDCGLRLILDRLGEQWTVMTLAELSAGPRRYRELERALVGISQRMMTLTLRRLERDGHVRRHVEPTVPPSVTYELSPLGHAFAEQVARLVAWSRESKTAIEAAQTAFDRRSGS